MAGFGVFAIELVRWELLMPQKFHQGQSHKIASQNYGGTNWRPSTGAVALTLAPTSVAERGHGGLLLPSWEGKPLTINPTLSGFSVNGRAKAGWMGVLHALRVEKVSFWIAADHRAMASPPFQPPKGINFARSPSVSRPFLTSCPYPLPFRTMEKGMGR